MNLHWPGKSLRLVGEGKDQKISDQKYFLTDLFWAEINSGGPVYIF